MRPLAWWPKTAGVIADAVWPDGAAVAVSPRHVLREQVRHAESLGLRPVIASELEFTLFDETAASLETKGYTSLDLHGVQLHPELVEAIGPDEDLLGTIRRDLEASAIPVESLKSEYSRGQFEIALGPGEALESADRHVLYKLAVREISRRAGVAATFMPKWHEGFGGSSCHLHVSLNGADGRNVFGEEAASGGALESFIGGVQHHARDVFLLWAPYVNSYKRFRRGSFAPSSLSWGEDNRTAALRVTGQGAGRHLENRLPGADVNPYLAYAGLLAAGLSGIEQGMQPGHAVDHSNAYQRDDLPALPASVPEAVEAFATSDFTRASFGDEAVDHISNFANKEFEASQAAVTDWERRRFFDL